MAVAPVQIDTVVLGPLAANAYILRGGGECWVVDPGWPGVLPGRLRSEGLSPSRMLLTHGHADHMAGARELKEAFPRCLLCCPAAEAEMLADAELNLSAGFGLDITAPPPDELLEPLQTLVLGGSRWIVLDTGGHTPGGVSYYCPEARVVLTGDALFQGSIGRCDLPGSDGARLRENIRRNLLGLPDDTKVLAGHGFPTTIGMERVSNPYR